MEFLFTIASGAVELLKEIASFIFAVFVFVAFLVLLSGFLPNDPFRQLISDTASALRPYYDVINAFIPVSLMASLLLFQAAFNIYTYVMAWIARHVRYKIGF